ncbi:MAG: arsenate reductase family protein [Bullifex sp.]
MLQVIGRASCRETQKTVRWLSERRCEYQFVDLSKRKLSEKEWKSIFSSCMPDEYIDTECKYFAKNGYSWRDYDPEEEVMEHPELLRTPILRVREKAKAGFDEEFLRKATC